MNTLRREVIKNSMCGYEFPMHRRVIDYYRRHNIHRKPLINQEEPDVRKLDTHVNFEGIILDSNNTLIAFSALLISPLHENEEGRKKKEVDKPL